MVGDVAHRVDVFLGRAGGDQHVLAGQGQVLEAVGGAVGQVGGFEHAAHAHVAAGLAAGGRAENLEAAALQELGVGLGGRVAPHGLVHGRGDRDGGVGGQYQGGQQVVGNALGQAGDQVGGGRGDQHQVGPLGQLDVAHGGFGRRVQQVEVNRVAGQGLHGQRGDEFTAATGHDHAHFGALVEKPANQLCALVGGNAAADAENDAFPIQTLHWLAFPVQ
eukprot:gene20832-biopygen11637